MAKLSEEGVQQLRKGLKAELPRWRRWFEVSQLEKLEELRPKFDNELAMVLAKELALRQIKNNIGVILYNEEKISSSIRQAIFRSAYDHLIELSKEGIISDDVMKYKEEILKYFEQNHETIWQEITRQSSCGILDIFACLIDTYADDYKIYANDGSIQTIKKLLNRENRGFKTLKFILDSFEEINYNLYDRNLVDYFEYSSKDIQNAQEEPRKQLESLLDESIDNQWGEEIRRIRDLYLRETGWKKKKREWDAVLKHLSSHRIGLDNALLRFLVQVLTHLTEVTGEGPEMGILGTQLRQWLGVKGWIFAKEPKKYPEQFDAEQFLTKFPPLELQQEIFMSSEHPVQSSLIISLEKDQSDSNTYHPYVWLKPDLNNSQFEDISKYENSSEQNSSISSGSLMGGLTQLIEKKIKTSYGIVKRKQDISFSPQTFVKNLRVELFVNLEIINLNYNLLTINLQKRTTTLCDILLRLQRRTEDLKTLEKNNLDEFDRCWLQTELQTWKNKWQILQSQGGSLAEISSIEDQHIGLISWQPLEKNCIDCMIENGLVAAIWCREEGFEQTEIETAINNLVQEEEDIRSLPQRLLQARREANRDPQNIYSHLSLIWDDPNAVPLKPDSSNYPLTLN